MYCMKQISYRYESKAQKVLDDITFNINKNKVTAIVGPSGCGKSTLVSILSGVIPRLLVNGVLEGELSIPADAHISVVSQTPENQLFGYEVEDALAFGIENMGIPSEEIVKRMEYVIRLLQIEHLKGRSIAALSGGQRQAVCIASVLAMKPDILIMDEPVSSLDPNGKSMVQDVLRHLKETGQTTIIVDNNLDWFSDIVDNVIGLADGRVVFEGSREEFFTDFALQDRLGVTIPQEVEIYKALHKEIDGLELFYNLEGAKIQIGKILKSISLNSGKEKAGSRIAPDKKSFSENETIITAENITKVFEDGFVGLQDINASFKKGKVISILGQNGSGKTTLVKHLNGLLRPTGGKIRYLSGDIAKKSVAEISRDIILVFQHPEHMLFEENVYNELTFCARTQKVSFEKEEALKTLETYGLLEKKDLFPLNLSMGERHTLTILSVLYSSAEVIILDEPTLGMDLHLKKKLEDIICSIKEQGKTVIMISHEIPLVFKLSDEILILDKSKKAYEGTKEACGNQRDLFEKINLKLPPVVVLSQYFGFQETAYDVNGFVDGIKKIMEI